MILVDTSAWVEYLRATDSAAHRTLRALIESDEQLATSEPIVMEILAGAQDEVHVQRLRRLMNRASLLPLDGLADFEHAADTYRLCRRAGESIRSLIDCLVATVALRHDVEVLHSERDFDAIARHVPLKLLTT